MLSECTVVMGCVFNIDVSSLELLHSSSCFPLPDAPVVAGCHAVVSCEYRFYCLFCASLFLREVSRIGSCGLRPQIIQDWIQDTSLRNKLAQNRQ
jgi:hypothetical protein